jgi:hypothetical protein
MLVGRLCSQTIIEIYSGEEISSMTAFKDEEDALFKIVSSDTNIIEALLKMKLDDLADIKGNVTRLKRFTSAYSLVRRKGQSPGF